MNSTLFHNLPGADAGRMKFNILPGADAGRMDGHSSDEWITPEIAASLLEKNHNNRTLNDACVERYCNLIRSNDFFYGGGTIKIDITGRLIDGQHRLAAIVASGIAQRLCVQRGLHPDTQAVIDTGRKRSAADWLHILGFKDQNALAAAVRLVATYYRDPNWTAKKRPDDMENGQIAAFLAIHPDVEGSVGRKRINITPSAHAMTHYVLGRIDSKARDEFFDGLESGAGLDEKSPILSLRNWAFNTHNLRNNTRTPVPVQIAYIFKSWNYWRTGRSVRSIHWRTEGSNPESFPVPQ
jgi:hypothetical protein